MIIFCFTTGTFVLHASPSLQTGGDACGHPIAPFAKLGVCTRASYRGLTGSEGRDGANGVWGGIGDGNGNGDDNGVGGRNGHVNGDGDGDGLGPGTGTGTGVEAN